MSATLGTRDSSFHNRSAFIVIAAAALILSVAMGIRQTFGLFVGPFSFDRGMPITLVAFAIALHNLVWGFAQPFAGAAADRYGAAPVVAFGAIMFAAGLTWPRWSPPACSSSPDWASSSASASAARVSVSCSARSGAR